MIKTIIAELELRLEELESKEGTMDNLSKRLELIKTLLMVNKTATDYYAI